jgi:hypothetical protein
MKSTAGLPRRRMLARTGSGGAPVPVQCVAPRRSGDEPSGSCSDAEGGAGEESVVAATAYATAVDG